MNDIQGYVEIVKNEFKQYISYMFNGSEEQEIVDKVIEKYVECRYFCTDYDELENVDIMKYITDKLKKETLKLGKKYDYEKVHVITQAVIHIMPLDGTSKTIKYQKIIDEIITFLEEIAQISVSLDFPKAFLKHINKYKQEKNEYLEKFDVEYFKLKLKKTGNENIKLVTLAHNIDFPEAFNEKIIQQVFESGITLEDKLLVEYHMTNINVLKDIIKGKYNTEYIVEFAPTLFNKKGKLDRVLKVIAKDYLMERINLQIEYKNFTEDTKNEIYSLMRQGYKIAIKLDETFIVNEMNINMLDVFSCIVVTEKLGCKDILLKNKTVNKKILNI